MTVHTDERKTRQETPAPLPTRRGIIAAAERAGAEIATKPVVRSGGGGGGGIPITAGDTTVATATTTLQATTSVTPKSPAFVAVNNTNPPYPPIDAASDGVSGRASGADTAGVFGRNNDLNGVGLWGEAPNGTGTFGDSNAGSGVAGRSYSGAGVYAVSVSGDGVHGSSTSGAGVSALSGSGDGVHGEATGVGAIGVHGMAASGTGGMFEGGRAPIRLVPGSVAGDALTGSGLGGFPPVRGHQAGELYVTSDHRLFLYTGKGWREIAFVP